MKYGWVLKNRSIEQLFYSGSFDQVSLTLDKTEAGMYYSYSSEYYREVKLLCFGDWKVIKMPMVDTQPEGRTNCSVDFLECMGNYAIERKINEKNFILIREVLRYFDLYEKEQPKPLPNKFAFVPKDVPKNENVGVDANELQRLKEFCAKKEFLDGIIKYKPMKLKGNVIEQPYQNIYLPTQNDTVYGSYTTGLRHSMFCNTRYFKKIRLGETLQPWQWKVDKYEGWITSVIAPRRGGKTYMAAYKMIRELVRDRQDSSRPTSILYVGINQKKNKTMIKYLLAVADKFLRGGYFEWYGSESTLAYIERGKTKKDNRILGTIELIGAKDDDAGVGGSYDYIVFDEVERLPVKVIEDILPIITNEGAKALLISTLNKQSKRSLFYDYIVKGEKDEQKRELMGDSVESIVDRIRNQEVVPHINIGKPFEEWVDDLDIEAIRKKLMMERMRVGLRFTGEDVDYWTEQERDIARSVLKTKPHIYFPERLGIFADTEKVFDGESVKKEHTYFHGRKYKYVVVGYDPAEKRDKAPLLLGGWNEFDNTIEIIDEDNLPKNFTAHGPMIKNFIGESAIYVNSVNPLDQSKRVFFAYDYNGVGHGLEPYLSSTGIRIDLKLRATGSEATINKKGNAHTCGMKLLIEMAKNVFENGTLLISDKCENLLSQLETYVEKETQTGYIKTKASGNNFDDSVSALLIIIYFCLECMQEKYKIDKSLPFATEASERTGISDEERNKLYLPYIRQGYSLDEIKRQFGVTVPTKNKRRKDLLSKYGY